MKRRFAASWFLVLGTVLCSSTGLAQTTTRPRPPEWDALVPGARFIDRFQPMRGEVLSEDTWGGNNVIPRYVDNGIEDRIWSYWGGNVQEGADGKYHLFVCGWLEISPKGHHQWRDSYVFDTISDTTWGPFKPIRIIGKGHNPEALRLNDGRYVIYVIDGRYVSEHIGGPWEYGKFDFDARGRRIIDGLSNLSFAQREDGSHLMVCRGGGIWVSETGLSPYNQLTDRSVYPPVEGRFEDPVLWRDSVQYHMIVNDWFGRIAYYLRSKDGVNWVVDPGEAYAPGIAVHPDGLVEDWFKYERIKVLQDEYGRAVQANFAVIDVLKNDDKSADNHSSKNIAIPLNPGLLLSIENEEPITPQTEPVIVRIKAEEGFDPLTTVDVDSLRFGASKEVNFGRGARAVNSKTDGEDLLITFGGDHGITDEEFAPKLIGTSTSGEILFGYARLPSVDYIEPILSARPPQFDKRGDSPDHWEGRIIVENFGQVASREAALSIVQTSDGGQPVTLTTVEVPSLDPYAQTEVTFEIKPIQPGGEQEFIVKLSSGRQAFPSLTVRAKLP